MKRPFIAFLTQFRDNFLGFGKVNMNADRTVFAGSYTCNKKEYTDEELQDIKMTNSIYGIAICDENKYVDDSFYNDKFSKIGFMQQIKCNHDKKFIEQYSTGGGWMADVYERTVCSQCGSPMSEWKRVW